MSLTKTNDRFPDGAGEARSLICSPRSRSEDSTALVIEGDVAGEAPFAHLPSVSAQGRPSPCARSAGHGTRHQPGTTPPRPARAHIWGRWSARSWRSQRGRAGWGITNAVKDILAGNVGALAAKVEAVMASTIPVVLDFLATLIGIGGKITEIIQKALKSVTQPIQDAIDAVLLAIKKAIGGFIDRLLGKGKPGEAPAEVAPGTPMTTEQIIAAVVPKLSEPTKSTDPAEALAEKKAQAEELKKTFQPSAPEGKTLHIEFKDRSPEDVESDATINMEVGFSPGTPVNLPLGPPSPPGQDGSFHPGGFDREGRNVGISASITPLWVAKGQGQEPSEDPVGFLSGKGLARGHLLAAQLGGPGGRNNLMPIDQATNNSAMKRQENAVAKSVLAGVLVNYSVVPHYGMITVTTMDLPGGLAFFPPGPAQADLPDPIPLAAAMVAVPQGTESLNILDPSDQRNELKKKRLKPDAGAIGRVQGVSFRVDEAVRKDAAIDLAKQQGKIR